MNSGGSRLRSVYSLTRSSATYTTVIKRSVVADTHLPWIVPNQQIVEPNKLVGIFHNMGAPWTHHEEQIIGNS